MRRRISSSPRSFATRSASSSSRRWRPFPPRPSGDWANAKNYAVNLIDQPATRSWPIVSATFIELPKDPKDPARSAAVMKFFDWAYTNGDTIASGLEYIPLPAPVKAAVRARGTPKIKGREARPSCRPEPRVPTHQGPGSTTCSRPSLLPPHSVPQRKLQVGDTIFAAAARFAGAFVLILLGAIIVLLFLGGLGRVPSRSARHFLVSAEWDPVQRCSAPPCRSMARWSPRSSPWSWLCRSASASRST